MAFHGDWIVDHAGTASTGLTWVAAYVSLDALLVAETVTAGQVVVFGHDHVDPFIYSGTKTYTFATGTGLPVRLVSVTQGTGSVSGNDFVYQKATANQLDSAKDGAHVINLTNQVSIEGLQIDSGEDLQITTELAGTTWIDDALFFVGDKDYFELKDSNSTTRISNLVLDLTADSGSTGVRACLFAGHAFVNGLTILNGSNRTGRLVEGGSGARGIVVNGFDFSSCTNGSTPDIYGASNALGSVLFSNGKVAATHVLVDSSMTIRGGEVEMVNISAGNNPEQFLKHNRHGEDRSTTAQKRTSGSSIEGVGSSRLITTNANVGIGSPFLTNWFAINAATGNQNFDMYLGHNTQASADVGEFTDVQVFAQLRYKAATTSDEWTLVENSTLSTDSGSTWTTNPDYEQKLRIVVNPLTAGLVEMRIGCTIASMVTADDFYYDPKIFVSTV